MNKISVTTLVVIILGTGLFLNACSNSSSVEPNPPDNNPPDDNNDKKPTRFENIGPVAPDGVLETVAWNINCYGLSSFCSDGEIDQQTKNILTIIDSLNADLYAFEELANQKALNLIALNMKGYKGFVAKNMNGTQITGFVYNTNVIDSISTGLIKVADPGDWGSPRYPRYPFYFKFDYTTPDTTYAIYAVVIHAEAGASSREYQSRRDAAKGLYTYLVNNKHTANIILLGDYNDDVDVSIYNGVDSPYEPFIKDNNSFKVVTMEISKNGQTTYISYDDTIDHITISNELFDDYVPNSAKAITKVNEWLNISIKQYEETTTGHYPVLAKFDL